MASARDVAAYIVDRREGRFIPSMVVLKLLYYAQAWQVTWFGRPLFDESVEAWEQGPVVADVWGPGGVHGFGTTSVRGGVAARLTGNERAVVDAVVGHYGHLSGDQLSALTHREDPWIQARVGLAPGNPGTRPISVDAMRSFHTQQLLEGAVGPAVPTTSHDQPDEDDVLVEMVRDARTWRGTLDWLATR